MYLLYCLFYTKWGTVSISGHAFRSEKCSRHFPEKALQSLTETINWLHEYVRKYSELIAPITDLLSPKQECLAIIWAINCYHPYLEDKRFTLRTENKTLTWLINQKDTRAKLTRWHLLSSEYSFDIEHCPGKDNELPELLRQRIIWEYHDAPFSGHPGDEETLHAMREYFIWPGMSREIRRYVAGCHLCLCCKPVHG